MTKDRKPAKAGKRAAARPGGSFPICIAMVICEQAIVANDNTVSAIRIVDTLGLAPDVPYKPGDGVELGALKLLVVLKNAEAAGKVSLLLVCSDPTGKKEPVGTAPDIAIEGGPEAGRQIIVPVRIHWGGAGVYWLELLAGDKLIARTPLRINLGDTKKGGKVKKTTGARRPGDR